MSKRVRGPAPWRCPVLPWRDRSMAQSKDDRPKVCRVLTRARHAGRPRPMLPHRIRVHPAHLPGVLLRTGRAYRRNARPTYPDGGSACAIQACRLSPANGRARRPRGQASAAPFGDVHSIGVDETWELKRSWISGPMWPCPPTAFRRPIRTASDFPVVPRSWSQPGRHRSDRRGWRRRRSQSDGRLYRASPRSGDRHDRSLHSTAASRTATQCCTAHSRRAPAPLG